MPDDFAERLYRPLAQPHPTRLCNWNQVENYASAEIVQRGSVSVVRYRIATGQRSLCGKRLVFASDFHTRTDVAAQRLSTRAAGIIRKLAPDYLLLGGDLLCDARDLEAFHTLLAQLQDAAPVTLAIPGNWERGKAWLPEAFWQECYRKYGMYFLCNASYTDREFFFYGSDDCNCGFPSLPEPPPGTGRFNILLTHRPDTVIALDCGKALEPYQLILAGHTHGGQLRLPFIGPLYASSRYGLNLAYGRFRRRNSTCELIVSSGIGNRKFPGRFNCRREIVLLEFMEKTL